MNSIQVVYDYVHRSSDDTLLTPEVKELINDIYNGMSSRGLRKKYNLSIGQVGMLKNIVTNIHRT